MVSLKIDGMYQVPIPKMWLTDFHIIILTFGVAQGEETYIWFYLHTRHAGHYYNLLASILDKQSKPK